MEQPSFSSSNSSRGTDSMGVMLHQPGFDRSSAKFSGKLSNLWGNLRSCLQDYFNNCIEQSRYTRIVAYHTHQFATALKQLQNYSDKFQEAQTQPQPDRSWSRQRIAFDNVMEAELITVFGNQPTPLHSYDGPVGIIYVLDGELTVSRYSEANNEISHCTGISKLNCQAVNRYRLTQGTLIDSILAPVVEMQANTERCIFLNIHLRDQSSFPHYFYYPSYLSQENEHFFARRVPSEW
jgi:hypothetical protein